MAVAISTTKTSLIEVITPSIKYSNKFVCIGWVRNPIYTTGNSITCLAVSDKDGNVEGTDGAINFELIKDDDDYRLKFLESKSKKINLNVSVDLNDGEWHMLGYQCDTSGNMSFFADINPLDPESGIGLDGIAYSKAYSTETRLGGGDVWCPYLTEAGQAITLFNWRYASDFGLYASWIRDLYLKDRRELGI